MISKNKLKFIKSLQLKKKRAEQGCFTVEGKKSVLELAGSDFKVRTVVCTPAFLLENKNALEGKRFELEVCSDSDLESVSSFKTSNSALAVAEMKADEAPGKIEGLALVLDGVSDPGNMGTLLRTADWFGIKNVIASETSADFYNPKVLQASMGSFCRVLPYYTELDGFLSGARIPVYAAGMKGQPVHHFAFAKDCFLILGGESRGLSPSLLPRISQTIGIPGFGKAESLNVSAAAAVLCDNYRRVTGP